MAEAQVDISIFIPCLNEADNIADTLDNTIAALKNAGVQYEILVVDDGSTDNTSEVVTAYQEAHPQEPIMLHRNEVNQGIALSFLAGTKMTTGKYYRMVCGDNVEDETALTDVFNQIGKADIVLVYPISSDRTLKRRLISRTYNTLVNLISGYEIRYYNGVPIVRRDQVAQFINTDAAFGFFAEMVVQMLDHGADYVEIGEKQLERQGGSSKAFTTRNFVGIAKMLGRLSLNRWRRLFKPTSSAIRQHTPDI